MHRTQVGSILALGGRRHQPSSSNPNASMTPYGFVEIADGSDSYVRNVLQLALRLSHRRRVMLRVEPAVRPRVESMLESLSPEGDRSRIELVDKSDRGAAIPAVQAAGYCVFNDTEMTAYLREDQVAIYSWAGRFTT